MSNDMTVVYYTSNREDPVFEGRIQETLLEATGDLPINSVSRKPISFGEKNICVGDIGVSARNMMFQVLTGAIEADTRFVGFGEADVLYHKSYFEFRPERDDTFYYPGNVRIVWYRHYNFWPKGRREITCIANRKHFIRTLSEILRDYKEPQSIVHMVRKRTRQEHFHLEVPVITIKTLNGMHWRSPCNRDECILSLPYWGDGKALMEKYFKKGE